MKRPSGVMIAAVLAIATGILQLLASLYYFGVTAGISGVTSDLSALATGVSTGTGVVLVLMGVAGLVFAYGALRMHSWAWTTGIVLFVLNLAFAIGLAAVASSVTWAPVILGIVSLAIIGYMYTHDVREAFGHEHRIISRHTPSPTA